MAHLHNITGTDKRFRIDPITRAVTTDSDKVNPIQYDNNSVRFVFEVPRFVGGHDMALCDKIEIHYINFASATEKSEDVYLVDDITVDEWAEDKATFSWLLSANATKYAGPLNFLIRFICLEGETVIYAWHTDICKDISVCDGINNSAAAIEMGTDVLEAWRKEVLGGTEEAAKRAEEAAARADAARTKAETAAAEATARVADAVKFATDKVEEATNAAAERAEDAAKAAEEAAERAESASGGINEQVEKKFNELDASIDAINEKINYEPIKFNSLTMEPSTTRYEHGNSITGIKLKWKLSKAAKSITVNGTAIDPADTEYEATGPFTSDQEWRVVATDEKGGQATGTKSIDFYYLVYWGVGTKADSFDADFVTKLQHNAEATSKSRTFSVTPNAEYIYYVVPKDLGKATFKIDDGFAGGFNPEAEVTVTKTFGERTVDIVYYIYRSTELIKDPDGEPTKVAVS